jgi:hypothetical protein
MTTPVGWSREERVLFNPAFTALVCCRVVQGHASKHTPACPLPIVFVAAIMALQPSVRGLLPRNTNASVPTWVEGNEEVRVHMAANSQGLMNVLRPGLVLALQTEMLALESSDLILRKGAISAAISGSAPEVVAIQRTAHMLGRWLPTAGTTATVLTLLGVRP